MAEKVDRLTRINALLKRELANLFERNLRVPSGMLVSVTEVNVSVDLRNATIYVSIFGGKASDRQTIMHELAEKLHVKAPSASKMTANLKEAGYLAFPKYGYITLTEKGREIGNFLLWRHEILHRALCLINHSTDELEQVEKIEHFISPNTLANLEAFLVRFEGKNGRD